jgi:hypothetical protein
MSVLIMFLAMVAVLLPSYLATRSRHAPARVSLGMSPPAIPLATYRSADPFVGMVQTRPLTDLTNNTHPTAIGTGHTREDVSSVSDFRFALRPTRLSPKSQP